MRVGEKQLHPVSSSSNQLSFFDLFTLIIWAMEKSTRDMFAAILNPLDEGIKTAEFEYNNETYKFRRNTRGLWLWWRDIDQVWSLWQ